MDYRRPIQLQAWSCVFYVSKNSQEEDKWSFQLLKIVLIYPVFWSREGLWM